MPVSLFTKRINAMAFAKRTGKGFLNAVWWVILNFCKFTIGLLSLYCLAVIATNESWGLGQSLGRLAPDVFKVILDPTFMKTAQDVQGFTEEANRVMEYYCATNNDCVIE